MAKLDVCIRQPPGAADPASLKCFPAFAGSHGLQWVFTAIEFPPITQPFELMFRAVYIQPVHILAIDDITFHASLCGKSTRTHIQMPDASSFLIASYIGFGNKQRRLKRLKIHQSVSDVTATDAFPTQAAKRIRFKRKTGNWVSPPVIGYHEWQLLNNSQLHYESPTMLVVAGQAAGAGTSASSSTSAVLAAKHNQVSNVSSQVSTAVSQSPQTSPRYTTPADSLSPIIPYMVVDLLSTSLATPRPGIASGLDVTTQTPQPQRLTADIKSVHLPNVTEFLKQFAPVLPLLSGIVKVVRSNEPAPVQLASNLPLDIFQRPDENSPIVPLKLTGSASGPAPYIFASPSTEKSNGYEDIIKDFSSAAAATTELTPTTGRALKTHSVFPEKMETNNSTMRHILNIKKIPKNNSGIEWAPKRTHQSSFAHLPPSPANIEKVDTTDRLQQLTLKAYQQVGNDDKRTMGARRNSKKKTRKFASNRLHDHFSYDESSAHHRTSEIRQANWKTVRSGTAEKIRSKAYADRPFTEKNTNVGSTEGAGGRFDIGDEFFNTSGLPAGTKIMQWMVSRGRVANSLTGIATDYGGRGSFIYAGETDDANVMFVLSTPRSVTVDERSVLDFFMYMAGTHGRMRVCIDHIRNCPFEKSDIFRGGSTEKELRNRLGPGAIAQ
uniref:MAM domain-containing protein n=1 Tax=Parascaris univalens TaxID=6257 RepID=A0A914ZFT3_PARUN